MLSSFSSSAWMRSTITAPVSTSVMWSVIASAMTRRLAVGRPAVAAGLRVDATAGLSCELVGRRHQPSRLPFRLARDHSRAPLAREVQHRPQFAEPVQEIQAEVVLFPAGPQRAREVAIARPEHGVGPVPQPGDRLSALIAFELPPPRRRDGPVSPGRGVLADEAGHLIGQLGHGDVQALQAAKDLALVL